MKKYKDSIIKIIPFLLLLSFLIGAYLDVSKSIDKLKHEMTSNLSLIESRINSITIHNINKMKGVTTYLSLHPEFGMEELNFVIDTIVGSKDNIISNIGVFKDTTAIYFHPYSPNKSMANVNLVDIPSQKDDALRVKNKNEIVITPPVDVVQGGKAIIVRLPILLEDGSYWGQLGYMIKYEDVIEGLNLDLDNFNYKIVQTNKTEQITDVILDFGYQNTGIREEIEIEMPSSYWTLSISNSNILNIISHAFYAMIIIGLLSFYLSRKLILEIQKKNEELHSLSQRDELTGLKNRRAIKSSLGDYSSVILFDIDDFKQINDAYGHFFGDGVLVELSKRIQTQLRDQDAFIRWGGEEFIVLVKSNEIEICMSIANRIKHSMVEPLIVDGKELSVTCSIGVACPSVHKTIAMSRIIENADTAMYRAKENGKNKIERYSE